LQPEVIVARFQHAPLIRFRLAMCGMGADYLSPLREADPRWTDTLFTEGRRHMASRPFADVLKAAERFSEARDAFPDSFAIVLALAHAQGALGEYEPSLASYDSVLAKEPMHRDALLGRVMDLSYLNRHQDGVASATQLIELGTWHIGDAYYWRAWNRYQLKELDAAWDDVERSTKLLVNTSVYTLAGFIAYARQELQLAIDRFERAYAMDKTNCEAVWTASLVHVDLKAWGPAASKFSTAMSCFVTSAAHARDEIARIQAANVDEGVKAKRVAAEQKRVETGEHRAAQAAFNAAQSYALIGEKTLALTHVDMASDHPLMREKATTLKAAIEKMP
jgi:tetratricopeptide (TPR) repeat protein